MARLLLLSLLLVGCSADRSSPGIDGGASSEPRDGATAPDGGRVEPGGDAGPVTPGPDSGTRDAGASGTRDAGADAGSRVPVDPTPPRGPDVPAGCDFGGRDLVGDDPWPPRSGDRETVRAGSFTDEYLYDVTGAFKVGIRRDWQQRRLLRRERRPAGHEPAKHHRRRRHRP